MIIGTGIGVTMQRGVSAAAIVAGLAPFFDDFNGDGQLSLRTGWSGAASSAFGGGGVGAIVTQSGNVVGTNGAYGLSAIAIHDTGAAAGESAAWTKAIEGAGGQFGSDAGFVAHPTMDINNGLTAIGSADIVAAGLNIIVNGGTTLRFPNMTMVSGAVRELRTINSGGTMYTQLLVGGRQYDLGSDAVGLGLAVSTVLGRAANGKYGYTSQLGGAAARNFAAINRSTDRWITLIATSPIVQTGSKVLVLGEYGGPTGIPAPTAADVKIYGKSSTTDAVLTGFSALTLANFQAANGAWQGELTLPTPEPDGYYMEVRWSFTDANAASVYSSYQTHNLVKGNQIMIDGQSQVGYLSTTTSNGSITAPANSYFFQMDTSTSRGRRVLQKMANNTLYAEMATAFQTFSNLPFQITMCGLGGHPQSDRMPGTQQFVEAVEGSRANGRPAIVIFGGGTSTEAGNIYDNILVTANGYEDAYGLARGTLKFGISPEGSILATGAAPATRRDMWRLCRDFPTRFNLIAWRNEVQHDTNGSATDPLHYAGPGSSGYVAGTTVGENEWGLRMMRGAAKALGLTSLDLLGPKMTSVARVNATTFDVTFNIGSFTDVEIANGAYAGDYSGGMRFSSASNFASTVAVTNCVRQSLTGSTAVFRFTLAAGISGTAYIGGPDGSNPFNPTNSDPINILMKDRASMIRGIKSGQPPAAVQPSYGVGGGDIDYLTA